MGDAASGLETAWDIPPESVRRSPDDRREGACVAPGTVSATRVDRLAGAARRERRALARRRSCHAHNARAAVGGARVAIQAPRPPCAAVAFAARAAPLEHVVPLVLPLRTLHPAVLRPAASTSPRPRRTRGDRALASGGRGKGRCGPNRRIGCGGAGVDLPVRTPPLEGVPAKG